MAAFFEETDYYSGPPLEAEAVRTAERVLGVRLPREYVAFLQERNGGVPRARCFRTGLPHLLGTRPHRDRRNR